MKSSPCRFCEKRTEKCHSRCDDYITWKKDRDAENAPKKLDTATQSELTSFKSEQMLKQRKRNKFK